MLDDKKRAEFDQALTALGETLPPVMWAIYKGCITQGFTTMQALLLTQTFILAQASKGVHGTSGFAPDENPPENKVEE